MSAPTPAPGDDRPREGYYPDPSIPGYVRYWNGSAWVPGTSRPAPSDGPAPAAPGAGPSVEETGPHFFDEDPAPAHPEPASAWGADRAHQSGFGGAQDRHVSWGAPDPRVPADTPDEGTTTFRRPTPRTPRQGGAPGAQGGGTGNAGGASAGAASGFGAQGPAGTGSGAGGFGAQGPAGSGARAFGGQGSGAAGDDGARGSAGTGSAAGRYGPQGSPGAGPGAGGFGAQGPHGSGSGADGFGAQGSGGSDSAAGGYRSQGPAGSAAGGYGPAGGDYGAGTGSAAGGLGGAGAVPATDGRRPGGNLPAAGGQGPGGNSPSGDPSGPGFGAGKAAAERAAAQAQAGSGAGASAASAPAASAPAASTALSGPPQPAPGVPQQSGPVQAQAGSGGTPMATGSGGGQPSWAQQVHRLAGDEDGPVAPWKPPVEDVFQAAARRQSAARPAGLGKRLLARLVDTVVLGAVTAVAAVPLGTKAADHINEKIDAAKLSGRAETVWLLDGTTAAYLGIVLAVLLLFGVLYEALPTAKWGRTLGKKLCGLEVRGIESHEPPGFGGALRRWLVYSVPGLLGIGIIGVAWCLFDRPWHQCWHDKAAHTFVAG
ncbi:RDD family protein [Streptomyces hokutonensis]|uniref:RDD family protein n=1 Tax=Streptomyces hokutonensis TaxID=1306990 RepID=UPI0036B7E950